MLYILNTCAVFKNNTGYVYVCLLSNVSGIISTEVRKVPKDAVSVESCGNSTSDVKLLISTLKFYVLIKLNGFLIKMSIQFASIHAWLVNILFC